MEYRALITCADEYARQGLIVEAARILTVVKEDMQRVLHAYENQTNENILHREEIVQMIQMSIANIDSRTAEIRKAF